MLFRVLKTNPPAFLKRGLGGVNLFRFILILLVSFPLIACAAMRTIHWQQQVQLQDGRVITLKRISERTGNLFPENVVLDKSQTLSFVNPDTREKITWQIPKGLKPYTLAFDNKIPYLVLNAYTVNDYNIWNCPNPPYLVYSYENKKWSAIPFEQLPEQITTRNLVDVSTSLKPYSKGKSMSLAEVEAWLNDVQVWRRKEYRTISRKKIHPIGKGCEPSVLFKNGRESEINVPYYKAGVLITPKEN